MIPPLAKRKINRVQTQKAISMASTQANTGNEGDLFTTREEAWDRFILIVKPEQSGKTFVMIKKINEFLEEETAEGQITVNFIFCDNSLLLTKQTKNRIHEDVQLPDVEEPYVELSSRKDGSAKNNWQEVRCAIEDGTRNVICCTNGKRTTDIQKIITRLNEHNCVTYDFKIWLDEADKFTNYIKDTFIPLLQLYENVGVYMLTATAQDIFKKYKEIRCMPLENTTLPTYHGWDDCNIIIKEDESGGRTVPFARQIADEMLMKGDLIPGFKGYVPADTKKKTHREMRDMFVAKGVAVFTVNGEGLELALPHDPNSASLMPLTPIKIKKTEELHVHIRELYADYNVSRFPCVVTGNICVGRGISIQQSAGLVRKNTKEERWLPGFMFNFAILSNCRKKSEASQNAGRLKGNFKDWEGYAPPDVYTTEKFNKVASEYETQSRVIARIAWEKVKETGAEEGTALVTNVEVKSLICSKTNNEISSNSYGGGREPTIETFETQEEAKEFYNTRLKKIIGGRGPNKRRPDENGLYRSTIGKGNDRTKVRTTLEIYAVRKWSLNETHHYTFHPCYIDINDKSTLQWWFIYHSTPELTKNLMGVTT